MNLVLELRKVFGDEPFKAYIASDRFKVLVHVHWDMYELHTAYDAHEMNQCKDPDYYTQNLVDRVKQAYEETKRGRNATQPGNVRGPGQQDGRCPGCSCHAP